MLIVTSLSDVMTMSICSDGEKQVSLGGQGGLSSEVSADVIVPD